MEGKGTNYAEYEHSAPELTPDHLLPKPYTKSRDELARDAPQVVVPVEQKRRRKILGLPLWIFIGLIVLVIIIIAVAVPVAIVTTKKGGSDVTPAPATTPSHTSNPSTTATQSLSSTASSTPSATATALAIIDANYAGKNITSQALASIQKGPNIVVDMNHTAPWGSDDPWFGITKCLSILYSYGKAIRTFVACENEGYFNMAPGNDKATSHANDISRQGPSSSQFAIVSVVWGAKEIVDGTVYKSLYNYRMNKTAVPFTNDLFGQDTLVNISKSGIVWYTEDNFASFKGIFGREGDTIPF